MAFDTYMKIDGIDGESTAKGMEKQIALHSFNWGASNPTNSSPGTTGHAAGRATLSSFHCLKQTDKASPKLFLNCCAGNHIGKIVVTMRKASGDGGQAPFLLYEFSDCMIESVQWSGTTGGDDTPTESLAIAYKAVQVTYNPQDAKGAVGSSVVTGWDLAGVAKK